MSETTSTVTTHTNTPTSTQHVVFGDVGGYADRFEAGLQQAGWNPETNQLPEGVDFVQVGDLVHKGPDSSRVLDISIGLSQTQREKWHQLIGNHELMYLTSRQVAFWKDRITPKDAGRLMDAYTDGFFKSAYAFADENGEEYLITHAGLTYHNWLTLGKPNAFEAADAINKMNLSDLTVPGLMMTGRQNFYASPIWAEAVHEVYYSWVLSPDAPPFNQIHGHTSPIKWRTPEHGGHAFRMKYDPWFLDNLHIYADEARMEWEHKGKRFIAVDVDADESTHLNTIPGFIVK